MPDNSLGDNNPTIDIPRPSITHDPDFGVQRMLDGHRYPGNEGNSAEAEDELRNIHHP